MQAFNLSNVPFKAILKYFYCSICYQCFFLRIPRLQPVLYVCTNVGDSLTRFDNECQWLDNTDVVQTVYPGLTTPFDINVFEYAGGPLFLQNRFFFPLTKHDVS